MSTPASYTGTASLSGAVSDFSDALNPSNWQRNGPQIWQSSYPIDSSTAVAAGQLTVVESPLPPQRSAEPTRAQGIPPQSSTPALFFEEVLFGGSAYRNVLTMSYSDKSKAAADPSIEIKYGQYGCLNTKSILTQGGAGEDGGIDVDNGFIECIPTAPNHVQVSISKSVRFTKPTEPPGEVDMLAHLLVPLVFDVWLHSLIFQI